MPQDISKPADDGKISLPPVDDSMIKRNPQDTAPVKNSRGKEDEDKKASKKEKKKAEEEEQKILALARKRFQRCVSAESKNRAAAVEDLKFKAGDQWPADIKSQRSNDKRPCLTINKIPSLTHQVTNDLRQNRPAINVSPVGDKSDKEGARAFAGMINAIERDCAADIAYDTAICSAADIGFGYVRVLTDYEKSTSFNRVIIIKRVRNPFTVYLDPERQEPDGCDSRFGFITEMMDRGEFKDKYPGKDQCAWTEKGVGDELKEWITKDNIRIAEYFTMEHDMKRLVMLDNGHVGFYGDLAPEVKKQIEDGELNIEDEREAECQRVVWHKITALQILDTEKWPGRWIPIVEFLGEEIDIQGEVIRSGLIRNAKDPQRMKNYMATAKIEAAALAPKAPYLIAEGQDEGYESEWKQVNTKSFPALHYVPVALGDKQVPPPIRANPVGIADGFVEAEKSAEQDMLATTGVRIDPTINEFRKDESGKQLQEHRRNNDLGSYHYMDNASRSLRHIGRMLVDLIPKIYDTRRVVTILQEDDTEERITIDPTAGKPFERQQVPGGQQPGMPLPPGAPQPVENPARKLFNPGMGEYGVTVTIGPSYATKRIEASDQMMNFAKALPEKGALIAHLIAKYSDWPGSDECYRILAKALPPNLLTPDIRDLPPQMQAFVQSLQQQMASLMAERVGMLRDLTNTKEDREIKKKKIETDFEAKMLKIMADLKVHSESLDHDMIQTSMALNDSFHSRLQSQQDQQTHQVLPVSPVSQPQMPQRQQQGMPEKQNAKGWVLHKDKHGNMAYVSPQGEIEHV
jgi:hypothetical protein